MQVHPLNTHKELTWLCLEMPKFDKTLSGTETRLEEWLFYIKNLEVKPEQVEDEDFRQLLETVNCTLFTVNYPLYIIHCSLFA